jgi:regulator of nucleoside diphosphate kinase
LGLLALDRAEVDMKTYTLRPQIVVGRQEHHQLQVLAMAGTGHSAEAADDLLYEMERARVVPDAAIKHDVVRMGSRVQYRTDTGECHEVTLVYPGQADILARRISVLTPVGTALIGLRTGQSITWTTRNGTRNVLTVLAVFRPDPDPEPDLAA